MKRYDAEMLIEETTEVPGLGVVTFHPKISIDLEKVGMSILRVLIKGELCVDIVQADIDIFLQSNVDGDEPFALSQTVSGSPLTSFCP